MDSNVNVFGTNLDSNQSTRIDENKTHLQNNEQTIQDVNNNLDGKISENKNFIASNSSSITTINGNIEILSRDVGIAQETANANTSKLDQDVKTTSNVSFDSIDLPNNFKIDKLNDNIMRMYTSDNPIPGIAGHHHGQINVFNYAHSSMGLRMEFFGNARFANTIYSTSGTVISSDDRLKHNEVKVVDALSTINRLSVVKYDKTSDLKSPNFRGEIKGSSTKEIGLIAQQVNQIPELSQFVRQGDDDTPWSVDYNSVFCYSLRAIQELSFEVNQLKHRISQLEHQ